MKYCFLVFFLTFHLVVFSQYRAWEKVKIDDNLTLSLPGPVERADTVAFNQYEYRVVNVKTDNFLIIVTVSGRQMKIRARNKEEYDHAIDLITKGSVKFADENSWHYTISDITLDKVPGKKLSFSGKYMLNDSKGCNYIFLVNDFAYSILTIFPGEQLTGKDSLTIQRLENSIDFTDKIHELGYRGEAKDRQKRTWILLGLAAVVAIVLTIFLRRL